MSAQELAFGAEQMAKAGIQTTEVKPTSTTSSQISLSGMVELAPESIRNVTLPSSARLTRVLTPNLSTVKAGDIVAKVQSAQWIEFQTTYLLAQTELSAAKNMLDRDRALMESGLIASKRVIVTEGEYLSAQAKWQAAREQLKLMGASEQAIRQITKIRRPSPELALNAPSSGQVNNFTAQVGQEMEPGVVVFQVVDPQALLLTLSAPANQVSFIANGNAATIEGCGVVGKVSAVGLQMDNQSQAVPVKVTLNKPALSCVRANQVVTAKIQTTIGSKSSTYEIPESAVINQEKRNYIFVKTSGGFTPEPVDILARAADNLTIRLVNAENGSNKLTVATTGTVMLKGAWSGLGGE